MKARNDGEGFQIYVADLAEYNAGKLIGGWVTPAEYGDAEELQAAIDALLSSPSHEWAVHDSVGVKVSEHPSLGDLLAIASATEAWGCEKVQAAIEHGVTADLERLNEAIAECDAGEYPSKIDWAHEHIESTYDLDKLLGNLAGYFDYQAFARDAELGGDVSFVELSNGNVWVLNRA